MQFEKNNKIGIFGGTFNPPHIGHINSMVSVKEKAGLDKVFVIPTGQSPIKHPIEGPTKEQRLEMVKQAITGYEEDFIVDEQEIERGGISYTVDTVNAYLEEYSPENIFLIVGMDTFNEFHRWKEYEDLLSKCNLLVTSRPGCRFPVSEDETPEGFQELIEDFSYKYILLKSGRSVQFIDIEDVDISATELRKRLRTGKNLDRFLTFEVENYIKENKLYDSVGPKVGNYEELTEICANVLFEKKAIRVRGFDLTETSAASSYTLVCSGTSTRQVNAFAEQVMEKVKEEYGVFPYGVEGVEEGKWILIDYGALVIHIFYDFVRHHYELEELWQEGVEIELVDPFKNMQNKDQ